jgi:hypothetical protein
MHILWLNWSDIQNPHAYGAGVFTLEVLKRLAKKGLELTLFTSRFNGCQLKENINGIDIIREGSKYTVCTEAKN